MDPFHRDSISPNAKVDNSSKSMGSSTDSKKARWSILADPFEVKRLASQFQGMCSVQRLIFSRNEHLNLFWVKVNISEMGIRPLRIGLRALL